MSIELTTSQKSAIGWLARQRDKQGAVRKVTAEALVRRGYAWFVNGSSVTVRLNEHGERYARTGEQRHHAR